MERLAPLLIVFGVLFSVVAVAVFAVWWARKSSRRAALLGWGLQFLGAGMNPQPPPQDQIEEVNRQSRIKKDSECGSG
jgi:hypothetical protein